MRLRSEARALRRRRVAEPLGFIAFLLVFALLGMSCSFERRPEPQDEELIHDEMSDTVSTASAPTGPAVAALHTVELFRESVATGDLSLALGLLDREATLVDALVGEVSDSGTRGEFLLELRGRLAGGILVRPIDTEVTFLGREGALATSMLSVVSVDEDGEKREVTRLYESVLLVVSSDGWRIRHFHRSVLDTYDPNS